MKPVNFMQFDFLSFSLCFRLNDFPGGILYTVRCLLCSPGKISRKSIKNIHYYDSVSTREEEIIKGEWELQTARKYFD